MTLTLTLKVKLAFKFANICFKLLNCPIWNLTFTLELVIDYLKVSGEFETSDLDLDLQGQIIWGESLNVCVIPCKCNNF